MLDKRKPTVFELGKNVRIEIWGGLNSIGGNCVVIKDRDEGLMLDQGLSFSQFKKFYGGFIEPEIVEDLREIGAIPPKEAYENVLGVYISHLHIDHLGSLSIPFEYDVKLYVPSKYTLEKLSRFWTWGWKELLLPSDFDLTELEDISVSEKVKAIQVSHSAFPAYSFLVETSEGTIFYSGDFRTKSPLCINTLENFNSIEGSVDVAIVEGTNFLRRQTPLTPDDAVRILKRILDKYKRNYLFLSIHPLDVESFLLASKVLQEYEFTPVLTHTKYAELFDMQLKLLKLSGLPKFYLLPLRGEPPIPLHFIEIVEKEEVLSMEKKAFLTSITGTSELKMLIKLCGIKPAGLFQITLVGEPLDEEGWIAEERLMSWLRKFGIDSFRIHLSGHYYPYEFKEIIHILKPKQLIPIHTNTPKHMKTLFEKYSSQIIN